MSDGKAVVTQITLLNVNEVSEEQEQDLIESKNADSLEEVAEDMEEDIRSLLAHRVFADADKIPLLDVNTDVEEEYREEEYSDLR